MSFTLGSMVGRLRSKADIVTLQRDDLSQDGTSYNIPLSSSPVISGSETIFLNHITFTTGLNQFVYRSDVIPASIASGFHITYAIDYERGELEFYQGSGLFISSSGLAPFAPWSTSTVTAKYKSSTYSDDILADYLGYAVSSVEIALQIGMHVSGVRNVIISGVTTTGVQPSAPPMDDRKTPDVVNQFTRDPYSPCDKLVIADDVEILQDIISAKAAFDLSIRERRIGAGNAIKIVDGDTQIDTSVNQRFLADFVKDLQKEYDRKIKWVMHNMLDGYTLRQLDEQAGDFSDRNIRYN